MDITIFPGKLSGTVRAIPSKSQADVYKRQVYVLTLGAANTLTLNGEAVDF